MKILIRYSTDQSSLLSHTQRSVSATRAAGFHPNDSSRSDGDETQTSIEYVDIVSLSKTCCCVSSACCWGWHPHNNYSTFAGRRPASPSRHSCNLLPMAVTTHWELNGNLVSLCLRIPTQNGTQKKPKCWPSCSWKIPDPHQPAGRMKRTSPSQPWDNYEVRNSVDPSFQAPPSFEPLLSSAAASGTWRLSEWRRQRGQEGCRVRETAFAMYSVAYRRSVGVLRDMVGRRGRDRLIEHDRTPADFGRRRCQR